MRFIKKCHETQSLSNFKVLEKKMQCKTAPQKWSPIYNEHMEVMWMRHQDKLKRLLERIDIDEVFKKRAKDVTDEDGFRELLEEFEISATPEEFAKYYQGFLKMKDMDKISDIPEILSGWLTTGDAEHLKNIKL